MTTIDIGQLAIGNELADGGQGSVHELEDDPSQVFKRYHNPNDPAFTAATLRRLVAVRESITYAGMPVDEFAAWPRRVVVDGSNTLGFIMQRAPSVFSLRIGQAIRLADLSYLATPPKPMWGEVDLPGLGQRVQIVRHLAGVMDVLHRRRIVMGDLSFANVLWSCTPSPRVMLLDCDGMRHEGDSPVLPQPDTIDWQDPLAAAGAEPDFDRDRYKLALAVLRVLTTRLDAEPGDGSELRGVDGTIRDGCEELLARAAGAAGLRPAAAEWSGALSGRAYQPTLPPGSRREVDGPPAKPELLSSTQPRQYRPITPPGT